jgi:feruloyl esterase
MVGHIHEGVTLNALGPDHQLTTSQLKAISTRVIQQCDALDGVKDGILRDPRACKFDPHVMTCTSGQPSGECLTTAQADAVERIYEGPRDPANGARLAWGDNGTLGLEDRNWAPILVDATGRVSPVALAIAPIAAVLLYGDPARDVSTDLATTARELATKVRPIISPDNPDLSRARDLHRKILMFHGWADPNIKPQDSVEYFEAVEKRMGDVGDFFRFFMIPGMAHCGAGPNTGADFVGPDANSKRISQLTSASNNWQLALERWVEEGKAPEKIIATEFDLPPNALPGAPVPPGAGIKSTRPLCTYPKVAVYNGSGPITSAASFECKLP